MLTADGSAVERLMRYFRYWAHTQGSDLPGGKCLVVKLGPEVCDLSEDMRGVLKTGTDAIIKRITQCIEQGQLDGSVQAETPRSEERRVGKECVSTCRSRGSAYH